MTFWKQFLHLLRHRPNKAMAALYWHLTRRRVRARIRMNVASADLPFAYSAWIQSHERPAEQRSQYQALIREWPEFPRFSLLLLPAKADGQRPEGTVEPIQDQIYPHHEVVDCRLTPLRDAIRQATGKYLVPVFEGDQLAKHALLRFAQAIKAAPDALVVYGDEDSLSDAGDRVRPWFKPRWNAEMFLALDFLSSAAAIRKDLAIASADLAESWDDVLLTATSRAQDNIVHTPHVVAHVARNGRPDDRVAAVQRHLAPLGGTCTRGPFDTVRVTWPLPRQLPLVSIIVPTKDKLEFLRPCVESVLNRTDYPRFELVIVDNDSVEPETAGYLAHAAEHPSVRVLPFHEPYNFSAINNFAARRALGSYICLLNNDTEVLEPGWLSEMMRYAVRPEIGAVGAKLLYADGSIQHAGVVIGIGGAAGHAHRYLEAGNPGYFGYAHVAHYVSAVTAACLTIDRRKFLAVGGLDEDGLAVAFNDVDLCLKLEAAGWRNVYVPHAVLTHHESKSRGQDISPTNFARYSRELDLLQTRWRTKSYEDPLHSPHLDRDSETFVLKL